MRATALIRQWSCRSAAAIQASAWPTGRRGGKTSLRWRHLPGRGTIPSKTFREAVCSFAQGAASLARRSIGSESDRPRRPSADELLPIVSGVVARRESSGSRAAALPQ